MVLLTLIPAVGEVSLAHSLLKRGEVPYDMDVFQCPTLCNQVCSIPQLDREGILRDPTLLGSSRCFHHGAYRQHGKAITHQKQRSRDQAKLSYSPRRLH